MISGRSSGILLHPTSLPGPHGIGTMGAEARRFIRDLRAMRQSVWQLLPFSPTGFGDSPYQGLSSFAGNPLWIDLASLVRDGLLLRSEYLTVPAFPTGHVDFGRLIPTRARLFRQVASAFPARASSELRGEYERFCEQERDWLDDFALFTALKQAHKGQPWTQWPEALARRRPQALRHARRSLGPAIERHRRIQFLFHRQWTAIRQYARREHLRILGDIPLFVAHDSADAWARPDLFLLDPRGNPSVVAGVPPDYFCPTGQRWGNPMYNWATHAEEHFAWWIRRIRRALSLTDAVRIDHFRGLAQAWEIPASEPTAERGRWVDAPGADLFEALRGALGSLPLVAEDLGHITPDVHALRDRFDLPGMRVLPFTLDTLLADPNGFLEHGPEREVFYSGTHDNDTLAGWLGDAAQDGGKALAEGDNRKRLLALLPTASRRPAHRALVELVLNARAGLSIFPIQDILGLGSEARMNRPGTSQGNWQWRLRKGGITAETMAWIADATTRAGRA